MGSLQKMIPKNISIKSNEIRNLDPCNIQIKYYIDTWRKNIGKNQNLEYIAEKYPYSITRNDLFEEAKEADRTGHINNITRLFIGTMIWGYGTGGRGSWRTRDMINTEGFEVTIFNTFKYISNNNVEQAYRNFKLNQCRASYFTKFFYFIGYGVGIKNYPLILDNCVYENLKEKIKEVDVDKYSHRSYWTLEGYLNYITDVHEWAEEMKVPAHNIEYFLFNL